MIWVIGINRLTRSPSFDIFSAVLILADIDSVTSSVATNFVLLFLIRSSYNLVGHSVLLILIYSRVSSNVDVLFAGCKLSILVR